MFVQSIDVKGREILIVLSGTKNLMECRLCSFSFKEMLLETDIFTKIFVKKSKSELKTRHCIPLNLIAKFRYPPTLSKTSLLDITAGYDQ